jgi:translation initiation factor 4A
MQINDNNNSNNNNNNNNSVERAGCSPNANHLAGTTCPLRDAVIAPLDKVERNYNIEKWDDLELKTELLRGIYSHGFENPSPIQKTAIGPIVGGRDIIGQAQSGTGKTGAFTVGLLQIINVEENEVQALVIAPTHELVHQSASVISNLGSMMTGLRVKTLVGGTSVSDDAHDLRNNIPHVIVGSAGRVFDMIKRRHINMRRIKIFVLDEADEMLSRGFKDQIYNIFQYLPNECQVALFSATMPDEILKLTERFLRNPVKIIMKAEELNLEGIRQYYVAVPNDSVKFDALKDLFGQLSVSQCIIYVNGVNRVIDLHRAMTDAGFSACCFHSGMTKTDREKTIQQFRTGVYRAMISSNLTARGIDVQQVSVVINFDITRDVHTYLHRIGRSGRWGRQGVAINFITRHDVPAMKNIESFYKSNIMELPENFLMNR